MNLQNNTNLNLTSSDYLKQLYNYLTTDDTIVALHTTDNRGEGSIRLEKKVIFNLNPDHTPFEEILWKGDIDSVENLSEEYIDGLAMESENEQYSKCIIYNKNADGCTAYLVGKKGKVYYRIREAYKVNYKENENGEDTKALCDGDGKLRGNFIIESKEKELLVCTEGTTGNVNVKVFDENDYEGCERFGLTVQEVDKLMIDSDINDTNKKTIVLKSDAYIMSGNLGGHPENITIILDGGNLIRHHKYTALPYKIICRKGSFIDVPSEYQKTFKNELLGDKRTRIVNPNEDCQYGITNQQCNVVYEFNVMDFVYGSDYEARCSAIGINLNNVLERIFKAAYNPTTLSSRLMIKMPESQCGNVNFFINGPITVPYNVTIDMSGAKVVIDLKDNATDADKIWGNGEDYVFRFETHPGNRNNLKSIIKNFELDFGSRVLAPGVNLFKIKHIFDLTNFHGVLEGIIIQLRDNTDIIAFWQPFGTPTETYSDRKIIRRCTISNPGWRNETPVAIFCNGDGCIIEQSILGYVAIIGGRSYTIKGCLNDKYFLYDTVVDFNGSYWEIGQFEILDSRVSFANCRLVADNNFNETDNNKRKYIGPWMAIDTDGCRKRLVNMFKRHRLNMYNFNQVKEDWSAGFKYRGHGTVYRSTVKFDPTMIVMLDLWGTNQPMACPLFKVGDGARIIGIENLESPQGFAIHNRLGDLKDDIANLDKVDIPLSRGSWIPLINGRFADVKSDIIVPENITIIVPEKLDQDKKVDKSAFGTDWDANTDTFGDIRARILLDEQRQLYSKELLFSGNQPVPATYGNPFRVRVNANIPSSQYSNLKLELMFNRNKSGNQYTYLMRQHFSRLVNADMVCFGKDGVDENGDEIINQTNLNPVVSNNIDIADFFISKSKFNLVELDGYIDSNSSIEAIDVRDDLPTQTENCLNDSWGNMYEPIGIADITQGNVASRIQWIGENNIRAFMTRLPATGEWNAGDEVVTSSGVYRYFLGKWHQSIAFKNAAISQPTIPGIGTGNGDDGDDDDILPNQPLLP